MPDIALINDVFMSLSEARVSVEDRGFQFGDGVYELLRVYAGVPFRPAQHVARLARSAAAIGISLPHDPARWAALISEGVTQSGYPSAKVYIQVTRGAAPREHAVRQALTPTVVMTVRALDPSDGALYAKGGDAVTVADIRWGRCDIKSVCLLANVMAKQQAQDAGAVEALFIRDGCVWEGATSNVMIVQAGLLTTPGEGPWLLAGITRQEVLALARTAGIPVKEQRVTEAELFAAEEVFLTGTTIEVLPIVAVNGRPIGTAQPGPITRLLMARFGETHP